MSTARPQICMIAGEPDTLSEANLTREDRRRLRDEAVALLKRTGPLPNAELAKRLKVAPNRMGRAVSAYPSYFVWHGSAHEAVHEVRLHPHLVRP